MNPYASEDFNRMKVKGTPKEEKVDDGMIDHPLFEGKKIDMSKQELRAFTKAMELPEFKSILSEYVQEISDPKNKAEQEQYLRQLEEQGDLPVGTKLIKPDGLFCIKTSAKKLISEINKQFFDQKTFINVCVHELIQKPQRQYTTMPDGRSGYSWQLPYSVSKIRHDQDKNGVLCSTFDVVFHTDIANFIGSSDFKKFVSDTAVDGVNTVLAEHKEKCSSDYKILKNLKCKGGEPGLLTIKAEVENKLLKNLDINKHETKLQKEVTTQSDKAKEIQKNQEEETKKAGEKQKPLDEIDEEEEKEEDEEPMPTSVVQPKYKVVYSYPVELADCWEGPATTDLIEKNPQIKKPKELTVTINVKHVDSMKNAKLDINDTNLIFEYPNLYYLDLNLKYKCDAASGSAKFDKSKKTLTIRIPVTGLTEDSQKVFEENFSKYKSNQQKKLEPLVQEVNENEELNNKTEEIIRKTEEAFQGEANQILPPIDMSDGKIGGSIDDKYDMFGQQDDEKEKSEQEDDTTNQREQFLRIYKEEKKVEHIKDGATEGIKDGIKFREGQNEDEEEEDLGIKITGITGQNVGGKPLIEKHQILIQEISSKPNQAEKKMESPIKNEKSSPLDVEQPNEPEFSWEEAERVEANHQFIQQKEFVFVNIKMKGYNKQTDVRYALSENEIILEIRDKVNQVHKICKTLNKEIDVSQSSVELLVDFISVKLKKLDKEASWNQLGYDISTFTIPKRGQMKSNYLTLPKQEVVDKPSQKNDDEDNEKENQDNSNQQQVEEKQEESEIEKIHKALEKRKGNVLCYMNLESSAIYRIY